MKFTYQITRVPERYAMKEQLKETKLTEEEFQLLIDQFSLNTNFQSANIPQLLEKLKELK